MGINGAVADASDSAPVVFAPDNSLWGWQINGQALPRSQDDRSNPASYITNDEISLSALLTYRDLVDPASSNSFSFQLESNPHNNGHGWLGGWMQFCQRSPQDPIFWLFHCDIDRYWARWQFTQNRYDFTGSDATSYLPNDAYATGSDSPLGHHLLDSMWPWNNLTGPVSPPDSNAQRPAQAPNAPFPASPVPGFWPAAQAAPRPVEMIDYLGVNKSGVDLGYAYDDTPFGAGAQVPPAPNALAVAGRHMNLLANPAVAQDERIAAVRAVQRLPLNANQLSQLESLVKKVDEHIAIRRGSLDRLSRSEPARALTSAMDILTGKVEAAAPLRAKAAERVGHLGMFSRAGRARQADVRRALLRMVTEKEPPEVRSEALRWLAALGDSTTIDTLRDALANKAEGLVKLPHAIRLLGVAAPGENGNAIRPYLDDSNPELRTAALQSLGNDAPSLEKRRAILRDKAQPIATREAALQSLMHYDEQFPEVALAIVADGSENADLRAQAAAGVREYARGRVGKLGPNGLRSLAEQLTQASAGGPDTLHQTVARVTAKLVELKAPIGGDVR
jgi:hypothetical protein